MSAGTETGQFGLGYGHKFQSRNTIKYFTMTKKIVSNRPLQILPLYAHKRVYLVWCLWLIMEKSGTILVLTVFVGLKRIMKVFEKEESI